MFQLYFAFLFILPSMVFGKDLECSKKARQIKDCHFKFEKTKVQVWNDKIFVNDQVHRSQFTLPEAGEDVEWTKLRIKKLEGRVFLEMEYWGAKSGTTELSLKMWAVFEIKNEKVEKLWVENIGRRKLLANPIKNSEKFGYDKEIPHKITSINNKVTKELGRAKDIVP
jgi:hypothetical protein